jgi:hypothetical protein
VFISIFFFSSFISNITFEQTNLWGWFPRTDWFRNNYHLLAWVSHNINSNDLLMTDYSYTSAFLDSFSLKNVTTKWWPYSPMEIERARDSTIA